MQPTEEPQRRPPAMREPSQGPSQRPTPDRDALQVPGSPPTADSAAPEQPAPPSPVPTEIISPDLTQEEIVAEIQQSGIKVRDFAYEDACLEQRPPELFDPVLGWHVYELMLENPNPDRNALNPRYLRRLLDLGWVDEDADGHRWLPKDREALAKFDSRSPYPWKALQLTQPKKDNLKEVATSRFQWVNAEQLVPQFVNRGLSRLSAAFRGARRYQKRPANDATETEQDADVSPRLKKRRLSDADSAGPTSQAGPSAAPYYPVTLLNGKSPQLPSSRPSDASPRSRTASLPTTQVALSRSLQRHLSMTSVTSPCPSALSRSDSRTTLTQGAESE